MKKVLSLLLLSALFFTSCTKEPNEPDIPSKDTEVSFTYKINDAITKVSGSDFDSGDQISVFAANAQGEDYAEATYTFNSGKFTSTSPIIYSEEQQELEFAASYPKVAKNNGTFDIELDQSSDENYTKSDLLVATIQSSEACPELNFFHKMSAIEVVITDSDILLDNIDMTISAQSSAEYNLHENSYSGCGSVNEIIFHKSSDTKYCAIIAPQTVSQGSSFINYSINGTNYTWELEDNIEIESGYKYVCELSIESGSLSFSGTIEDWGDGGEIDGEIVENNEQTKPIVMSISEVKKRTVLIDVSINDEVGNYMIYSMTKAEFDNDFGGSGEVAAQAFVGVYIWAGIPLNVPDNNFIFNKSVTDFDLAKQTVLYDPDNDYVAIAFGIDSEGELTTDVEELHLHTNAITQDDYDTYEAWQGKWQITSTSSYISGEPRTFEVEITKDIEFEAYQITGWGESYMRDQAFRIFYDIDHGTISFSAESFAGYDSDGDNCIARTFADLGAGEPSYITGVFYALTASLENSSMNSANMECFTGTFGNGKIFTVSHIALCKVSDYAMETEITTPYADSEGNTVDQPIGPFTMVKVE